MHSAVKLPHVTLGQRTASHSQNFPLQLQLYCDSQQANKYNEFTVS